MAEKRDASGQRRENSKGQKDSKAPADPPERTPRFVAVAIVIASFREVRARFYFLTICLRRHPQLFRSLSPFPRIFDLYILVFACSKEIEMEREKIEKRTRARAIVAAYRRAVDLINEETQPGRDISPPPSLILPLEINWRERTSSVSRRERRFRGECSASLP